MDSGNELVLFH